MPARLEHVNYTVRDARKTAAWLCDVFGWQVRWEGPSIHNGFSMHVGSDGDYVAIYRSEAVNANPSTNYATVNGLNHIGITVDDLDATEDRVKSAGFTTHSHADYEPGRRFYFHDADQIEYEVVQYD